MDDKFEINKKYYNWDIKQGDYTPEIDDSYERYKNRKKLLKRIFVFSIIFIFISSIIVFLSTR
jgi:t-SNARE complex subunit (syntaxin)